MSKHFAAASSDFYFRHVIIGRDDDIAEGLFIKEKERGTPT